MGAYIDIVTAALPSGKVHATTRYELSDSDLRQIGKLTRNNVLAWMEGHQGVDWIEVLTWGPIYDFHAVCGDVDIPWATENGQQLYESGEWRVYVALNGKTC